MELAFNNLQKSYGKKEVLKGINFKVESGAPLAFLGRNGAGKSTTIKIMMNVISYDGGNITLDGKPFSVKNFKIGYLPEERGMYQKVNIMEQLIYFAELKGYNPQVAKRSASELLERVGLADYAKKKLEVLSKGNQQKVQIVQTLLGDPEIIIMDEPFSGLDPINADLLKSLILERAVKDKLMFFSSHQMGYVDEICTDLAILNEGVVVVNESIDKLKREIAGENVFIVPFESPIESLNQALKARGFNVRGEEDKVVVDLSGRRQDELLSELANLNVKIDSYGLLKPTLSDIFIHYAR